MQPRRIGRFDVERVLGQGGMGVVYVARDALLDRRVALKVLPPGREDDAADRHRLLREARSAAALSHPNVATVLEAGEDGGAVYLAMELVEGETLAERLARGMMSEADVVHIGLGIARGLASAHASGVLHRDLKPANVIVGPDLTPKLVDFGLARSPKRAADVEERLSYTGIVVGTPGYMSPEQVRGGATDARTDVFALGIVLHEMWSGDVPFGGTGLAAMSSVLYDEPRPLEAKRAAPPELRDLIARCLSREPEGRPHDASAVARVLAALASRTGPAPAVDPAPSSARSLPLAHTIEVVRSSVQPRTSISTLVGRETEILAVEAAMDAGHRLVTIAGPPGIGKTRVAAEIGRRATERGGRMVSVALGNMPTMADLEASMTAALRRAGGSSSLAELLALEEGLVLLDGGEGLGDALGARLEAWLKIAPKMRVLVSSRAILRTASEEVVVLAPLPEAVAVELFVSRAQRARPLLAIGAREREAAAEIARMLDGNPLAISLAAARVSVLSPVQIATRLRERTQDRLALLQDRSQTHGAASLAEAIAWSFQLLDPEARALAVELSVLAGPFDVETAEAIARAPETVLDAIERLRDASLLRTGTDAAEQARLTMDPNVRAFALRELKQRPDAAAVEAAHAHFFGELAERLLARQASASRETAAVHLDLQAAAQRARASEDPAALLSGLRAATLLALHGDALDPEQTEAALAELTARAARDAGVGPRLRARAALGLVRLRQQRDADGAVRAAREAVALAQEAGDATLTHQARLGLVDTSIAKGAIGDAFLAAEAALAEAKDVDAEIDALERAATVAWRRSELDRALVLMRQALALVEARRDRRRQADVLRTMGIVCVQQGRFDDARAAYERARELGRAEGMDVLVAVLANNLGVIHHEQERHEEARAAFEEAIAGAKKAGRAMLFAVARGNIGFVDQEAGANAEARIGFDEAIATLAAVGDVRYRGAYVLARAALLADEGDAARARAEIAAAKALLGDILEPQMAVLIAIREAYVELVCATDLDARREAEEVLRGYVADLARPDSIAARSDISRMALRLVRRRLS